MVPTEAFLPVHFMRTRDCQNSAVSPHGWAYQLEILVRARIRLSNGRFRPVAREEKGLLPALGEQRSAMNTSI